MKLHWSELRGTLKTIFRSTILGTFIGAIPGAGADIAAFVGYSEAKEAQSIRNYLVPAY